MADQEACNEIARTGKEMAATAEVVSDMIKELEGSSNPAALGEIRKLRKQFAKLKQLHGLWVKLYEFFCNGKASDLGNFPPDPIITEEGI